VAEKLLIIDVAALGYDLLQRHGRGTLAGMTFRPMQSVFPAVTCTVQASFRTASLPCVHGMVGNGLLLRDLRRVCFWEQSSALVSGRRIWSGLRRRAGPGAGREGRVGMLFWQQSLGEDADVLLSPAPVHKHHGGMIEDCYSRPAGLYRRLCDDLDMPFKLRHYWGPMASAKAGDWIALAARSIIEDPSVSPDLCLVYLPTLDYDLQRYGPNGPKAAAAVESLETQLEILLKAAAGRRYEVIVFGDYAMAEVTAAPVLPNLLLREAGLMQVRRVKRMSYADLHASRAFAVADHEVAHVYVRQPEDVDEVAGVLRSGDGIAEVIETGAAQEPPAPPGRGFVRSVDHPHSGELVIVAEEGCWFAYPWWLDPGEAPDYARHVDIHNKPGFDPCELFFGWPPGISQDAARVRGTHGRVGPGREVAVGATLDLPGDVGDVVQLAAFVRTLLGA